MTPERIETCRRSRAKNRERYNEQSRAYSDRHTLRRRDTVKEWRKRNPEKYRAYGIVAYHVSIGLLKKQPCACCGNPNVQAHHADYSKPLEVEWLCSACHGKKHRLHP